MPTPMRVFADLAARHGVDPNDNDAVDEFFVREAPNLPPEQQSRMLFELLQADSSPIGTDQASGVGVTASPEQMLVPADVLAEYARISRAAAERMVELSQAHFERALDAAEPGYPQKLVENSEGR
jgi:hypothetical protein